MGAYKAAVHKADVNMRSVEKRQLSNSAGDSVKFWQCVSNTLSTNHLDSDANI